MTEGFRIANKGNLALKWKVQVNKGTTVANEGNFDLLDVIDFYLVTSTGESQTEESLNEFSGNLKKNETSAVYYIKGVMQTTAGNDYQNLTLDGITITVYATQDTVENDSFGSNYDADATYPPTTTVTTDEEFKAALTEAKDTENMTIVLKKGTYGSIDVPVLKQGEKLSGLTIIGEDGVEIDAFRVVSPADYLTVENLTLKNLKFTGEGFLDRTPTDGLSIINCKFVGEKTQFKTQLEPKKNVRIENCYFDNENCANTFSSIYFEKGVDNLVIKGTTIKNSGFNAISLQSDNADVRSAGIIIIENNNMEGIKDRVIRMNGVAADAQVTIKGNTMATAKNKWFKASLVESGAIFKLNGNTVNGSSVADSTITSTGDDIEL